jgi:DNA polymerase-3 subunit beta
MQIQLSSSVLKKVFDKLQVIKPSSVLPITEFTMVSVSEDAIVFQATDIERSLMLTIPFQGLGLEPFSFLVPTTMFSQTIKNLPEEIVTITYDQKAFLVELKSKSGKYKMSVEAETDFPTYKEEESKNSFEMEANIFCDGIDKVYPFAANDPIRLALTGLKIDMCEDKLVLVATNAFIMSIYTIPVENQGTYSAVVPAKAMRELSSFIDSSSQIKISIYENNVVFKNDFVEYKVSLIDAKYPPYRSIIPDNDKTAKFRKNDLIGCLKRINIFSSNIKMGVLSFGDTDAIFTSEDIDFSRNASERLEYLGGDVSLDQFRIGFNISYFLDLLKKHDSEDIIISFSDPKKAMTIKEDVSGGIENFSLIMPLMVTDSQ